MISIDEIYNLVSRAIKHNYDDYEDMDPFLSSLKLELLSHGLSLPFILPSLFTLTSHLMGESTIYIYPTLIFNVGLPSILVGYPATGKSAAMYFVKQCYEKIENYYRFSDDRSAICYSVTETGLISTLANKSRTISFFDCMDQWLINASRDTMFRVLLKNLLNKPKILTIDRPEPIIIHQPRYNYMVCTHPQIIHSSMCTSNDHLFEKMFITIPKPPIENYRLRDLKPECIKLHAVMFLIDHIHKSPKQYHFDEEAHQLIIRLYEQRSYIKNRMEISLSQLRTILLCMQEKVIQISAFIHILNLAYKLLETVPEAKEYELSQKFETLCINIMNKLDSNSFVINVNEVQQANKIVNCSTMQLMSLLNYTDKQHKLEDELEYKLPGIMEHLEKVHCYGRDIKYPREKIKEPIWNIELLDNGK